MEDHQTETPIHFEEAFQIEDESQIDTSASRKRKLDDWTETPLQKKRKIVTKEVRDLILNQINNDKMKYSQYEKYYLMACRKVVD
jgi:hypothetical protein